MNYLMLHHMASDNNSYVKYEPLRSRFDNKGSMTLSGTVTSGSRSGE